MSEVTEKDFGEYLKEKIKKEISNWDAPDIYGVYIGISHNNRMEDPLELPFIIEIGYYDNKIMKWDSAFCSHCPRDIIETAEERDALIKWLTDMGVKNIGIEDPDTMYDKKMLYIGKGPAGLYETLQFLADFSRELITEKFISEKFGRDIPVIFDDLEHTWYCLEATRKANPHGQAEEFLSVIHREMLGFPDDINMMMYNSPFMVIGVVARVLALFTCTFVSALVTLIAGGIHIPLTLGGTVKTIILAIAAAARTAFMLRLMKIIKVSDDSGLSAVTAVMNLLADIIMACIVMFSCNLFPDRFMAKLFFIGLLIYIIIDYLKRRKAAKSKYGYVEDIVNDLMKKNDDNSDPDKKDGGE